jgi:hypothetical protein
VLIEPVAQMPRRRRARIGIWSSLRCIRRGTVSRPRRGASRISRPCVSRIRIRSSRITGPLNDTAWRPPLHLRVGPDLSLRPAGLLPRSLSPCPFSPPRSSRVACGSSSMLPSRPGSRSTKRQRHQRSQSRAVHPLRIVSSPAHVSQLPLRPSQKAG